MQPRNVQACKLRVDDALIGPRRKFCVLSKVSKLS